MSSSRRALVAYVCLRMIADPQSGQAQSPLPSKSRESLPLSTPAPLERFVQVGDVDSPSAQVLQQKLRTQWSRSSGSPHFDRAGYFQIALGLLSSPRVFPYALTGMDTKRLRFLNFGPRGFFVGMAAPSPQTAQGKAEALAEREPFEALEWGVTYLSPGKGVLAPEARLRGAVSDLVDTRVGLGVQDVRDAYMMLASGGSYCLAAGLTLADAAPAALPPPWMKCSPLSATAVAVGNPNSSPADLPAALFRLETQNVGAVCRARGSVGDLEVSEVDVSAPGVSKRGDGSAGSSRARCLLGRFAFEERPGFRTKLHCLSPQGSRHLWRNFDFVDLVASSGQPGRMLVLESRYAPPKVTEVSLDEGWAQILAGGDSQLLVPPSRDQVQKGGQKGTPAPTGTPKATVVSLPSERLGEYRCSATNETVQDHRLFLVPAEVYQGRRPVNVEEDLVYSYRISPRGILDSEILTWRQVMGRYPLLDALPPFQCVYDQAVDVKCGIRHVQTSVQVLWEMRSGVLGRVATPSVQKAVLMIQQRNLERIQEELGQRPQSWGLQPELEALLEETKALLHDGSSAAPAQRAAPLVRKRRSESVWSSYLQAPPDFWSR